MGEMFWILVRRVNFLSEFHVARDNMRVRACHGSKLKQQFWGKLQIHYLNCQENSRTSRFLVCSGKLFNAFLMFDFYRYSVYDHFSSRKFKEHFLLFFFISRSHLHRICEIARAMWKIRSADWKSKAAKNLLLREGSSSWPVWIYHLNLWSSL